MLSGKIISTETKETIDFATVYLKGTTFGCTTNEKGIYHLKAPALYIGCVCCGFWNSREKSRTDTRREKQTKYYDQSGYYWTGWSSSDLHGCKPHKKIRI